MVEDWVIKTMYATKRRRRTVKSVKAPVKDPPKSNPSKRHRERLNSELDHLASLLPFEQSVITKLDKLSILRLSVSYLRTKSYFQAALSDRYGMIDHQAHLIGRTHIFPDHTFSQADSILQALYGFLFLVTCDGEVFFVSRTVEQYLGFHQSDIIHQSVMELIHSEDREEFKRQLTWNASLPPDKADMSLHEVLLPENLHYLHRSFTVRFRCLLDNTSGFITLEINGWMRLLHGQNLKTDDPQLALFATCCPFGPMSLLDLPSRDLTFRSKHKMDLSPVSIDNRGRMLFGFTDRDLANRSGYDLIHPDDLNYFSSAHQELIKTGSSGLIAYRWQNKALTWVWLQSSCRVIYKNSKPDFVICTHRQLTDDEGLDLVVKRGNEFKLPYPLLDIDICSGFGFSDDELTTKSKSSKSKKSKSGMKDYLQTGRKKRCPHREPHNTINGYGSYSSYNGYASAETAVDIKSDFIYPYSTYPSFAGATVYPTTDSYKLEAEKHHGYANGYYLDHRQYHNALGYHSNGYTDIVSQTSKYGYGLDGYTIDLSKKVYYDDEFNHYDSFRKLGYDYNTNRMNGTLEAMYACNHNNIINGALPENNNNLSCLSSGSLLRQDVSSQFSRYGNSVDSSGYLRSPKQADMLMTTNLSSPLHHDSKTHNYSASLPQSSVIKSVRTLNGGTTSNICSVSPNRVISDCDINGNTGTISSNFSPDTSGGTTVLSHSSPSWSSCIKTHPSMDTATGSSPLTSVRSDHVVSPQQHSNKVCVVNIANGVSDREHSSCDKTSALMNSTSPLTGATPTSVIQPTDKLLNRFCEKANPNNSQLQAQTGIPVPVVTASPWLHHHHPTAPPPTHHSHSAYSDIKDAWGASMGMTDLYSGATTKHLHHHHASGGLAGIGMDGYMGMGGGPASVMPKHRVSFDLMQ